MRKDDGEVPQGWQQSEPSMLLVIYVQLAKAREIIRQKLASPEDRKMAEVEARIGMLVDGDRRWQHHQGETCVGPKYKGHCKAVVCTEEERGRRRLEFKAGIDRRITLTSIAIPTPMLTLTPLFTIRYG